METKEKEEKDFIGDPDLQDEADEMDEIGGTDRIDETHSTG